MKHFTKVLAAPILMVCFAVVLSSCSKDNSVAPAATTTQAAPAEILEKQPDPGVYVITKFIDTGDDETSQFNGYTFQFLANGGLVVTTNTGTTFNGSWSLNSAETVMTLNIAGTNALDDLDDDDWNVIRITNKGFRIQKNGPDIVIFHKQ